MELSSSNAAPWKLALGGLLAAAATAALCAAAQRTPAKKSKSKMKVPDILLDWDLSPEDIVKIGRDIIAKWKALDECVAAQNEPTFATTFAKLIDLERELDPIENAITFPMHVSPDEKVRSAAKTIEKELTAFGVESSMRRDVYVVYKAASEKHKNDNSLSEEEKRFMEKVVLAYERNGMNLGVEEMKEMEALKKELADLATTFSTSIAEDDTTHLATPEELAGCSESFVNGLDTDPDSGKLVLTMAYPHYMTVQRLCTVPATREALEKKFNSRCKDTNVERLQRMCQLRADIAAKLGYQSHAHHKLEIRMAKTPERVTEFLTDLSNKLGPIADKELEVLKELKAETEGGDKDDQVIHMWDYRFYMNLVEEKNYQVDHEVLRQYFPFDTVLQGMLSIYRDAFGLEFEELKDTVTWHKNVLLYKVKQNDGRHQRLLGYFYLDLWPRTNKYSHAACWPLQPACILPSGERRPAVTALVCNFPAPKEDGSPSLLEHNEVVTFFHEL